MSELSVPSQEIVVSDESNGLRRYSSDELFQQDSLIEIEHDGKTYRLQITRKGKLILTR